MFSDLYVREIRIDRDKPGVDYAGYPFCLPVLRRLNSLELHGKATFFVGENGTGKSTLLEAVAVNLGFNPEGGTRNFRFSTADTHSALHGCLKVTKGVRRMRDGFFLRAETLYNVATNIDDIQAESGGMYGAYGGKSLHRQSHGEAFMSVMTHRFGGDSLFLLDEPEAALSPTRQMALLSLIDSLIAKNSQFLIATHSPILLALPGAEIYVLTDEGFVSTPYQETEHYIVTREFLNNPRGMLKHLLDPCRNGED